MQKRSPISSGADQGGVHVQVRRNCCTTVCAFAAQAQGWPAKPSTILTPFPAGGGTGTFARPIAAKPAQRLGQQFILENQGDPGGMPPQEMVKLVRARIVKWAKVVKDTGAKVDN